MHTMEWTDLTLFGEAGAAGETADAGRSEAGEQAPPDAGGAQGGQEAPRDPEERRRAYRALVDGAFKEEYTEDTQHIINRRFRETRQLRQELEQHQPVLDLLMRRYGVADGDLTRLLSAMKQDKAYRTEAAEKAGLSPGDYERLRRAAQDTQAAQALEGDTQAAQALEGDTQAAQEAQERAQALARAQEAARRRERATRGRMQDWLRQAEELRRDYPDFDLAAESADPRFRSLLRTGAPLKLAYEALHLDAVKRAVAQRQARLTEKQVVNGIRARGARPDENGVSSRSAFTVKDDVRSLSNRDLEDIRRRVFSGERISFGK